MWTPVWPLSPRRPDATALYMGGSEHKDDGGDGDTDFAPGKQPPKADDYEQNGITPGVFLLFGEGCHFFESLGHGGTSIQRDEERRRIGGFRR